MAEPQKPERFYVSRAFYWNKRDQNGDLHNTIVPRGTIIDMTPRDAAPQVYAKRLQEFDAENQLHAKAVEEAKAKAHKPAAPK